MSIGIESKKHSLAFDRADEGRLIRRIVFTTRQLGVLGRQVLSQATMNIRPPDRLKQPGSGFFPVICRAEAKAVAKRGGEILAGIEAIGQGDVGNGKVAALPQLLRGAIKAAAIQEFDGAGVDQFAAVFGECSYAHAAMCGHPVQGPLFASINMASLEFEEKDFHRPAAGCQLFIFVGLLLRQRIQNADEQLV